MGTSHKSLDHQWVDLVLYIATLMTTSATRLPVSTVLTIHAVFFSNVTLISNILNINNNNNNTDCQWNKRTFAKCKFRKSNTDPAHTGWHTIIEATSGTIYLHPCEVYLTHRLHGISYLLAKVLQICQYADWLTRR